MSILGVCAAGCRVINLARYRPQRGRIEYYGPTLLPISNPYLPSDLNIRPGFDIRSQYFDIRSQRLDIRSQRLDIRSQYLDIRSQYIDIRSQRSQHPPLSSHLSHHILPWLYHSYLPLTKPAAATNASTQAGPREPVGCNHQRRPGLLMHAHI